jgi:predicted lipoprotein with Yx(FWY)xxD motif
VAAVCLSIGLIAGCGSSGTAVTSPFATSPPTLERGPVYQIKAAPVSGIGSVLVDGQGITVYMFANDHQGSPSRCYDICAVQWPPLVLPAGVAAPVAGAGIEPRLLGTAPRTDGSVQITYNGWPLYLWPPDRSPGKATGQGLTNAGGRWYVLDPTGTEVVPP